MMCLHVQVSAEMTVTAPPGPPHAVLWDTAEEACRYIWGWFKYSVHISCRMEVLGREQIQSLGERPQTGSRKMQKVELQEMRNIMERLKTTTERIMLSSGRNILNCFLRSALTGWRP